MSLHIHGAIVTHHGVGSNNRGENEGNITTLQKLLWNNEVHTTVSSEAIRWAVRYRWQTKGLTVRRVWDDQHENYGLWDDTQGKCVEKTDFDAEKYIDDDLMGFMLAEGAKSEGGAEEGGKKKRAKGEAAPKGTIDKRRGVLEVARAVSLTPYAGDVTFNAKAGEKGKTSLYATEVHATRYQYGFSLTPGRIQGPKQERAAEAVEALVNLGEVAGNHSRFLYDFSPESVALRITQDPSPRFLYCFGEGQEGQVSAAKLVRAVRSGDIAPGELIVGGALADTEDGQELKKLGVAVFAGVREAGRVAVERIRGGQP